MSKVLVSVTCPAVDETYDVFIPSSLTVREAASLLGKGFENLSDGRYISSGYELLCTRKSNTFLRGSSTVAGSGIVNGTDLVLI